MPKPIQHPGLRSLCAQLDMTVGELAKDCGCDRVSIYHYIYGRKSPRLEQRLAQEFNLTVQQLRTTLGITNQQGEPQ